jgi:hypothetical protein
MVAAPNPGVEKSETVVLDVANGPVVRSMLASVGAGPRRNSSAFAGDTPISVNMTTKTETATPVREMDLIVMRFPTFR